MHVCGSDKDFTWANCLALYFCVAFGCDWSSTLESVGLRLLFARVSASPERKVLYLTCHIQWFNTRYNINVDLRTYIFSRHNTAFYVLILHILTIRTLTTIFILFTAITWSTAGSLPTLCDVNGSCQHEWLHVCLYKYLYLISVID